MENPKTDFKLVTFDHDPHGCEFRARLKNVQGQFDVEFSGSFQHFHTSRPSEWTPNNFGKVNGMQREYADIELLIANNEDSETGMNIIDELLSPFIDQDHEKWLEELALSRADQKTEERLNHAFYQKQALGR